MPLLNLAFSRVSEDNTKVVVKRVGQLQVLIVIL